MLVTVDRISLSLRPTGSQINVCPTSTVLSEAPPTPPDPGDPGQELHQAGPTLITMTAA